MKLSQSIQDTFPCTISMPVELSKLLDYIEENPSLYFQTDIQFHRMAQSEISDYFKNIKIEKHFGLLGTTGDGSILAIWKNQNKQYYIHLGSDDDNWLILASNPIDFIKVIAIGYNHFDKNEIANPPQNSTIEKEFKNWVETEFNIKIPMNGKDIINTESNLLIDWFENE